jgi:hypothetical protein
MRSQARPAQGEKSPRMQGPEEREKFRRGVEQFNRREFYETHETLEEIWLKAHEPNKTFLQGVIQVACAFHHYLKGNRSGAESLLRRGLEKLEQFPPDYGGIRLETLRAKAGVWLRAVVEGESPTEEKLPRIQFNDTGDS